MGRMLRLWLVSRCNRPNYIHDYGRDEYSHGREQTDQFESRFGKRSTASTQEEASPQTGCQKRVLKRFSAWRYAQNLSESGNKTTARAIVKPKEVIEGGLRKFRK
jgi:hypothetical protein